MMNPCLATEREREETAQLSQCGTLKISLVAGHHETVKKGESCRHKPAWTTTNTGDGKCHA